MVSRSTAAVICMAFGVVSLGVAAALVFGLPGALTVVGVAFVVLSILLGWS